MSNISYSFVRTIVPKEQYKEREEKDEMTIVHLGAVWNEQMQAYECTEYSVSTSEYDEDKVKASYEEYEIRRKASELRYAIGQKLSEIAAYDTSSAVNGFSLNGNIVWLDKATRVGLMNSTNIAKAAGEETTTLWLGEEKIVVGCDMAIGLLSRLEMYALECFNVTARHRKEVQELTDIESVEAYDVTEGYPERLMFNINGGVGNADAQGKE